MNITAESRMFLIRQDKLSVLLIRRLRIHQSSCKKHFIRNNNVITTPLIDGCENVSDEQIESADILLTDEFFIEQIPVGVPNSPNYPESANLHFSYHDITGETFANSKNDLMKL